MKPLLGLVLLGLFVTNGFCQEQPTVPAPSPVQGLSPAPVPVQGGAGEQRPLYLDATESRPYLLAGNHNFDNFIGFMSNPILNIDPRAVTELWPIWGVTRVSSTRVLPTVTVWPMPSAGINVAIGERFSFGLNQGGYVLAEFNRESTTFVDRQGRTRTLAEFSGTRQGWLDLGGFAQYTVAQNVERQFLASVGLRWVAPIGSSQIFQGNGPVQLAPYVTVGKGIGEFHLLATAGYQFDVGSGGNSQQFYGSVHLDRRCFGWLYPLVEFNWVAQTKTVDLEVTTSRGYLNFGSFTFSGNLVSLAAGVNAVIIPNRLELGGVYTTKLYSDSNLEFNGFLLRMTLRY